MSAVQTMLVPFSSSGQENGGVKIEVTAQTVDPGEAVRLYLWGASPDALAGYSLTQGADGLGAGTLRQYPGQTEARLFDLDGTDGLKSFDWPVVRLLTVVAAGHCFVVDGNDVSVVALPGEDVTRFFRLSGNALAPAENAPKLAGSVLATAARSAWCREWRWTTPAKPAAGFPAGTCTDDEDDRDDTAYWFFLLRWGVLREEFSMELAWNDTYRDETSEEEGEDEDTYAVVFCIDTTGSMSGAIESVVEALGAFLNEASSMYLNIGVVTFGDEVPYRRKLDITNNIDIVSTFLSSLEGFGGADGKENQLDAIRTACGMFAGYNKRAICLITDIDYHIAGDGGDSETEATPDIVNAKLAEYNANLFIACYDTYVTGEGTSETIHPYNLLTMTWIGDLEDIMTVLTNNLVRELEKM
ncbi:hypothetical protein DesfrDRAFT_0160 [Solidesulfovibrio fructosivorans JJ]]|uniref:VWFA domain-containing protein n=1 Tax=Solidesulfovibrio fructosivorans JJ] TaxID=596151 RepID=E1JRB1_SOLFR|nr:vWA domain-containing protein [Solidesulfovibrio fructosivorans]EFL53112.1 hypothetical protein DesfrDRAFT_0160 [Solidesulfovibrio fructosivorans JJ]]